MANPSDSASPTSTYTEVERKFEVVETTVSPSFEGLSAVARVERSPSQQLDAVYFDTPGHDLAAHHVTLRRRTGGPDAGWHLKMPAGPDARTEVRAPLDDGERPAPKKCPKRCATSCWRSSATGRWAPVARITTSRTVDMLYGPDGTALAEFCDDQVTAWAAGRADDEAGTGAEQRWREWELELAEGVDVAPDLLDRLTNRLLDAGRGARRPRFQVGAGAGQRRRRLRRGRAGGAAGRPRASRGRRAGRASCWCGIARCAPTPTTRCTRCGSPPARSAACYRRRRGRSASPNDAWILDELRQLASVLGVARDAEVLAERYERALDELPPDLVRGPIRERLVEGAKKPLQVRAAAVTDGDALASATSGCSTRSTGWSLPNRRQHRRARNPRR